MMTILYECTQDFSSYLRVTIIDGYKFKRFWKIADLAGINFNDFEILI